ncbi:HET-domain-containing protein [Mytilinidion resinicola]|uniref:HET-domain-containing protein n=1 Tax=Mytilinidion resinicola TaxID=574789 RepID=A0A6A6YPM3_9PEZI|nr:HET-domain-containing protein [Mytilinidion resinicola]KAF2810701.1 HET-domain-containing protein [Mytilinidion resinicola]
MREGTASVEDQVMTYQPLPKDELRLLTLLPPYPATADEPIHCSLDALSQSGYSHEYLTWYNETAVQELPHERLRLWKDHVRTTVRSNGAIEKALEIGPSRFRYSWGDYIALSYTWGSPEKPKHIILNGVPFAVTENLDAALRNVHPIAQTQNSNGPLRVWADAICINQEDQIERSHEIKRMRSIFAGALGVVVALGNGWEGCDEAFGFIRNLSPSVNEGLTYADLKRNADQYGLFKEAIATMMRLIFHPYWHRVWVIQELAVGADPIIVACRNSRLLLEQWRTVSLFLVMELPKVELDGILGGPWHELEDINITGLLQNFDFLRSVCRAVERHQAVDAIELAIPVLSLGIMGIATDPRDHIYGLLGLLPKNILDRIDVDYSATANQVFADFMKIFIEETGELDAIFFRSQRQTTKPSWVTDWTQPLDRCYLFYQRSFDYDSHSPSSDITRKALFGLDKRRITSRADGYRHRPISFSGDYLHCHGFCIGEVDGFSAEGPVYGGPVSANPSNVTQPSTELNPYGNAKAVIKTLIATLNQNPSSNSASDTSALADIPWCGAEADNHAETLKFTIGEEFEKLTTQLVEQAPWTQPHLDQFVFFEKARRSVGAFRVGGKPLKEYFPVADAGNKLDHLKEACIPDIYYISHSIVGRRLAVLKSGEMALVPAIVERGDRVYVLFGAAMPVLLRRCVDPGHDGGCAEVIGECYVEGFMSGEGVAAVERGEFAEEKVTLC